jgi:imidazolonepropionase-like amidohydrolase
VVRALHVAGVQLGAGSDAGVKQGLDHSSIRWAAASFVNAGIPVADALFAMTQGAANVSGVGARKGRLTVGADADIVAVDANPLDDPCTLADPAFVMMRGAALFAPTMGGTSR